jgi:hypothetical protein
MIDKLEHYKRICSQIDFFSQRMSDSFTLFVQLSMATIGGFVWLKTQENAKEATYLFPLGRWVIPFLATFTIIQMTSDFRSWLGFRQAEANLLERVDLKPSFFTWRLVILRSVIVTIVAIGGFIYLR